MSASGRKRLKILIADDAPVNYKALRRKIMDSEKSLEFDADIDWAKDGEEAVQKVKQAIMANNPYCLVFMDIEMPLKSGVKATEEIRLISQAQIISHTSTPQNLIAELIDIYVNKLKKQLENKLSKEAAGFFENNLLSETKKLQLKNSEAKAALFYEKSPEAFAQDFIQKLIDALIAAAQKGLPVSVALEFQKVMREAKSEVTKTPLFTGNLVKPLPNPVEKNSHVDHLLNALATFSEVSFVAHHSTAASSSITEKKADATAAEIKGGTTTGLISQLNLVPTRPATPIHASPQTDSGVSRRSVAFMNNQSNTDPGIFHRSISSSRHCHSPTNTPILASSRLVSCLS